MLNYQIVYPVVADIYGDSFKEAVKNYVKFKNDYDLNKIIITDRMNNAYKIKLRYYMENEKNKVGMDFYPYPYNNAAALIGNTLITAQPRNSPYISLNTPLVNTVVNPIINQANPYGPNIVQPIVTSPMVTSANSLFGATANGIYFKSK